MRQTQLWALFLLLSAMFFAACGEVPQKEGADNQTTDRSSDEGALTALIKCGGPNQVGCPDGQYCHHREGECAPTDAGVCKPKPEICTKEYFPVCGCDGNTYGNACMLAAAGVSKLHNGPCKTGCVSSEQCSKGEFCDTPCDKDSGACSPIPLAKECPRIYKPVCGCNGKTYGNDCLRQAAQVGLAHEGQCKTICGGIAGIPCPKGQACIFPPDTCDWADAQGQCMNIPQACPDIYAPVCGCDGKTYGNQCEALAASMSIAHEGPCKTICGGIAGIPCPKGQACIFPPDTCDWADAQGQCMNIPQACPAIYAPVCGCDGKTYGNECEALAASMSIAHEGPCKTICGGFLGIPCPEGQACIFPPDTCNWADNQGQCINIPQACPDVWMPVCGCDGVTYGNECEALAASMSIAHEGPCKTLCEPIKCLPGTIPVDNDGDGCDDSCLCGIAIDCIMGWVPADSNGDGCEDTCVPTCNTACDCYAAGAQFQNGCFLKCMNCGNFWSCEEGVCVEHCGFMPPEVFQCKECKDNSQCGPSQFCNKGAGACDGIGQCEEKPELCTTIWAPVCGCDGQTYSNDCAAAAAGVNVAYSGECKQQGCKSNAECAKGEYCQKKPGDCEGLGMCVKKPDACILIYDPVCGCDGKTYGNACAAASAGINIAYKGECKPQCDPIVCTSEQVAIDADGDGCNDTCVCAIAIKCAAGYLPADTNGDGCDDTCKPVGCKNNSECAADHYCQKVPGDCEGLGKCAPRPQACILIYDPVCGCDGKTYGNACEAAAAGMNVAFKGECKPVCEPIQCPDGQIAVDADGDGCPDTCKSAGCKSNLECAKDHYCQKTPGDCEGLGKCAPRPQICILIYDPVCGCDGTTYGNACQAAAAGMNVAFKGECKPVCEPIQCSPEQIGVDTDGDGCEDTCECAFAIKCAPGFISVDTNGDGCHDTCKPWCKELLCTKEQVAVDTDGDGCNDQCVCAFAILCAAGFLPVDTNADGCMDACKPICVKLECSSEQVAVDTNNDGCPDQCMCKIAIDCAPGYKPTDSNGDGCIDKCVPFCKELLCTTEQTPVDINNDGCPDVCKCSVQISCIPGFKPADSNGDGCPDTCVPSCPILECPTGKKPVDTDGNGCADTCMCATVVVCPTGTKPIDTNNDGCPDQCLSP